MTAASLFRSAAKSPSAIIVGALLGLATVVWWPEVVETSHRGMDAAFPVVIGDAATVQRLDDAVIISITFTKRRDCVFQRTQAYAKLAGGVMTAIYAERVDRPVDSRSVPVGETYSAGQWKLWPTEGAYGVAMYVQHDCHGRQVSSKLAEVDF